MSVARSRTPEGPFDPAPGNPILTARGTDRAIQNTGHGDLVLGPDNTWLMVLLGVRPRSKNRDFSALGRETFVTEVGWHDGWPVAQPVLRQSRPKTGRTRIDFDDLELTPNWISVRRTPDSFVSLVARPGSLVVNADGSTLSAISPTFIGNRQLHQTMTATIDIDVSAGVGGIAVRTDEQFHYSIVARQGQVTACACISGFERVETLPFSGTTVELEISSQRPAALRGESRSSDIVVLAALIEGRRTVLLDSDGRYLSYEISQPFSRSSSRHRCSSGSGLSRLVRLRRL